MTTNRSILEAFHPCSYGLKRAAEAATLREGWNCSLVLGDMWWLVEKAHESGSLSRRRLIQVALRVCKAAMAPETVVAPLGRLCDWADGDDSVDLVSVRESLWSGTVAAFAHLGEAATAASTAWAVESVGDAVALVELHPAILCDVIRDAITIDELCAALNLDPEAGV